MSQAPANLPTLWSTMWECAPDVMAHIGDRSFRKHIPTSDQQKQENTAFKGPLCPSEEFKPHCYTQLQVKLDDAVLELGKLFSRVSSATEVGRKIDIVVQQQTEPNLPNIDGHPHSHLPLPPFLVFPTLIK